MRVLLLFFSPSSPLSLFSPLGTQIDNRRMHAASRRNTSFLSLLVNLGQVGKEAR